MTTSHTNIYLLTDTTYQIMEEDNTQLKYKKLKPGQKKQKTSAQEAASCERQAFRMQKYRQLKNLKKIALKLKNQVHEPLDTLFIVYERKKKKFKYFGCGELVSKFENGEVLMQSKANKSRIHFADYEVTTTPDHLTPGKYSFPFVCGSGKSLAESQKEILTNFPVTATASAEKTVIQHRLVVLYTIL